MDNEICKVTNWHWFKKISVALSVLYREKEDRSRGLSWNLLHEEISFPLETSERQKQHLAELNIMVMTLFYQRLAEIINKDSVKNALMQLDKDLYRETLLMLELKTFRRSEYIQWARDIVVALKKLTIQNNLLYMDTYVFCQLAL